jgi:hypothetical protein
MRENRRWVPIMTETNPVEIVVVEDSREDADLISIVLQEHQIDCRMRVRTAMKHGATVYFRKPSTWEEYMQLGPIIHDVLSKNARGTP